LHRLERGAGAGSAAARYELRRRVMTRAHAFLGKASQLSAAQRRIMAAKHKADLKLWAHLELSQPEDGESG
ncbi:MAG TPA: hypothetical protein VGH24_10590, partial [Solirubrobacteraceae bacterium]